MKTSILALLLSLAVTASAFAPVAFTRGIEGRSSHLFAEPPEKEEEEGLDLNLEEMFDMYVAW